MMGIRKTISTRRLKIKKTLPNILPKVLRRVSRPTDRSAEWNVRSVDCKGRQRTAGLEVYSRCTKMCRSQATPASCGDAKESIVNVAVYSADARTARNTGEMEKRRGGEGGCRDKRASSWADGEWRGIWEAGESIGWLGSLQVGVEVELPRLGQWNKTEQSQPL